MNRSVFYLAVNSVEDYIFAILLILFMLFMLLIFFIVFMLFILFFIFALELGDYSFLSHKLLMDSLFYSDYLISPLESLVSWSMNPNEGFRETVCFLLLLSSAITSSLFLGVILLKMETRVYIFLLKWILLFSF